MINRRKLDQSMATEKVDISFYRVIEKDGKRMLKPLSFNTHVSLKLVKAVLDNTIVPTFYETLSKNLQERGVENGTIVQLRAKFTEAHAMLNPELKGVRILCEVTV